MWKTCNSCKTLLKLGDKCKKCIKQNNKQYDNLKRMREATTFYKSKEWQKVRAYVLQKYNYIDLYLLATEKRIVQANTVHHIEPYKKNKKKALDVDNLIPLTDATHSKVHKIYEKSEEDKKELQNYLKDLIKGNW